LAKLFKENDASISEHEGVLLMNEPVLKIIYEAVDELNDQLPTESRIEKVADMPIMGMEGGLDSMALISLIVAVDQKAEEQFGKVTNLASALMTDSESDPPNTLGALADLLSKLLEAHES
jgi:hypothetical protein